METFQILSLILGINLFVFFCLFIYFVFAAKRLQRKSDDLQLRLAEEDLKAGLLSAENQNLKVLISEEKLKSDKLSAEIFELEKSSAVFAEREKTLNEKLKDLDALSTKIFESAREKFEGSNKFQIDAILSPLKDDIVNFRKRIDEINAQSERNRGSLENQIKVLGEQNKTLSDEAHKLATALKGDNKKAGNWGELVLERVLEECGLVQDFIFKREDSHNTESGRLRPDVVVKLPNERHLIIDSKLSLVPYERFVNSESEDERKSLFKQFEASVKTHITNLADKKYEEIDALKTPDFVMMFIPIEAAFSALIWGDLSLMNYAYEKNIVLVSPTTLLATLKTVEGIWNKEKQDKNTIEIANQGAQLHTKVLTFLQKFEKFKKTIDTLQDDFSEVNKTVSGKGGLIYNATKLEELGVKTKNKIDSKLLEDTSDE